MALAAAARHPALSQLSQSYNNIAQQSQLGRVAHSTLLWLEWGSFQASRLPQWETVRPLTPPLTSPPAL